MRSLAVPNVPHSAVPGSLWVFGFLVRMKEVQYAWIIGFNLASCPPAILKMEYMVAACMDPIPDSMLTGAATSQLLLVRDGVRLEGRAY